MVNINKLMLGGPVTNMKLNEGKNDTKVLKFTITTFKPVKDAPDAAQFHNVVFFNKAAEILNKHVKNGDLLLIQGEVEYRKGKDGESYTSIIGNEFSFIN